MPKRLFRRLGIHSTLLPTFIACTLLTLVTFAAFAYPQESQTRTQERRRENSQPNATSNDARIHVLRVQGNIYMLTGAGANITLQVGEDGVLLVDTGLPQMSDNVLAAIRSVTDKPIRWIINTSLDLDHAGGNAAIAKMGETLNPIANEGPAEIKGAAIIATQEAVDRLSALKGEDSIPEAGWPGDTYTGREKYIVFNGETVRMLHEPAAHTDGDSFVVFHRSDVVSTGDIFTTTEYPVIDLKRGGSIQGVINALNHLIYEIAAPGTDQEEGGTMIIPGHGRLCDRADVVYYQEMVTIIRDRIQYFISKGMTLDQVKQARPTRDYDPRYGADSGPWTTDMFVEAVYKSLAGNKETAKRQ